MKSAERNLRHEAAALAVAMFAVLALTAASSRTAGAQQIWIESRSPSDRFVVLSSAGDTDAAALAGAIDGMHDGLSALFGGRLPGPITVKIHPSREVYLGANPLVARVGEADATIRRARRAIDVYRRPAEAGPAAAALERDVRYAMAHLFIARKSGGRMAPGMQEGLARYLADRPSAEEGPGQGVVSGVARLRDAWRDGGLKGWDELSAPGAAYLDPEVAQPQSLSIIHFLVEVKGLGAVLDLVGVSAVSEGWRDAFDAAFSRSPSALEAAWLQWLPGYLGGGWQHHELYVDGVDRAEQLIRSGRYEAARDRIIATMALLEGQDPGAAARAKSLLDRAEQGLVDSEALLSANQALEDGRYETAESLAGSLLGRDSESESAGRAQEAAQEIARRARIGRESEEALEGALVGSGWRSPIARREASRAVNGFSLLGDEISAESARNVYGSSGSALGPLGFLLIAAGCAVMARNVHQRRFDHSGVSGRDVLSTERRRP